MRPRTKGRPSGAFGAGELLKGEDLFRAPELLLGGEAQHSHEAPVGAVGAAALPRRGLLPAQRQRAAVSDGRFVPFVDDGRPPAQERAVHGVEEPLICTSLRLPTRPIAGTKPRNSSSR